MAATPLFSYFPSVENEGRKEGRKEPGRAKRKQPFKLSGVRSHSQSSDPGSMSLL